MEVTTATEPPAYEDSFLPKEEEKREALPALVESQETGEHMEELRHGETLRIAQVEQEEKNGTIQVELEQLLTLIQSGTGADYPLWADRFHHIAQQTSRASYQANQDLFSAVIGHLIHPPLETSAKVYIPLLWDIGLDLLWLDFSKCREVEKEYFFTTFQIPTLVLQANKEFELGNIKGALSLLGQAKNFLDMHYSNVPILSDRRDTEKVKYTLSIADLEQKIDPKKALETLTNYMQTRAELMDMRTFFQKWVVAIVIFYVSRRAIFG